MLNPSIESYILKHSYRQQGRVLIKDVLDSENAEMVHQSLRSHKEWELCSYGPYADGAFSSSSTDVAQEKAGDDSYRVVRETSKKSEYSFRYYGYNLHKRTNEGLNRFLDYILRDQAFRQFIIEVTGEDTFNFISPQATYFDRGCFLRTHNDFHSINGVQTRKVAFVFGFTKGWDADWGGAFHVLDESGNIIDSQRPGFNTLMLFKVPTVHYVSPVAHYATSRRYAISGWFIHNPQAIGK